MIIHAKDDSISRTNFECFPEGVGLMDIVSQFKQHLEDIVEVLEGYREKSDIFRETGETTQNLQNEVKILYRKIQELEVENEKLRFELNENLNDSSQGLETGKFAEFERINDEVQKLKKLTQEQRDIINNYEELLREEKKIKKF